MAHETISDRRSTHERALKNQDDCNRIEGADMFVVFEADGGSHGR